MRLGAAPAQRLEDNDHCRNENADDDRSYEKKNVPAHGHLPMGHLRTPSNKMPARADISAGATSKQLGD